MFYSGASDSRLAGCALAFAFQTIGDLEAESHEVTQAKAEKMFRIAAIGAKSTGHEDLTYEEFKDEHGRWLIGLSAPMVAAALEQADDDETGTDRCSEAHDPATCCPDCAGRVVEVLEAAATTLKSNWKHQDAKKSLLKQLMLLAEADGTVTNNEKQMVFHVANLIDGKSALQELVGG